MGREHVSGLYELAYDQAHAQVARIASLPLLRAFPIRCAARQMTDLSYLLWSALRHAERDALLDLIERKLSRASMDVAQRATLAGSRSHPFAEDVPARQRRSSRRAASGASGICSRSSRISRSSASPWRGWPCRF